METNDYAVKTALNERKITELTEKIEDLREDVKTITTQLTAIKDKLTLYEGKFGGIVLTMSVVGAAIGYILHIAMSYLTRTNSP